MLIIQEHEYGKEAIESFKMMGRIYSKRNPFLIIIAGTFCMGKRTIVNQLTESFNISNSLNTHIVDEVLQMINPTSEDLEFGSTRDQAELLYKFKSKSKRIRDGCNFDMSKCYADGKDLLLIGSYIDPEYFLCKTSKKEQYKLKTATQEEINYC